ncbi:hypothetical protein MKW92_047340 [Papaver armeniacum]|nr:hypothetical protein MKW92_047340 [Papaver armeniacum]
MQEIPSQNPNSNSTMNPQNQFQMPTIYPHYYPPPPHQDPLTQIPNPNYTTNPSSSSSQLPVYASSIQPPGVESSNFINIYQLPPPSRSCYEAAQAAAAAAYQQQIQEWQAAHFHHNPDAAAVSLTTTAGTSMGTTVPAGASTLNTSAQWTYPTVQPCVNGTALNKGLKKNKKTKVVQSAYCEVCKIDCTSRDTLANHRSGKKHKKNLEKIKEAKRIAAQPPQVIVPPPIVPSPTPIQVIVPPPIVPSPAPPPNVVTAPAVGPQEKPSKKKKAALSSKESLDTKRRKLLEGGTAVEAVRICKVCDVVCNSQTVFHYHLAGQKHATMVKKLTAAGTIVT